MLIAVTALLALTTTAPAQIPAPSMHAVNCHPDGVGDAKELRAEVAARGYSTAVPIEALPQIVADAGYCHFDWRKLLFYNMAGLRASSQLPGYVFFSRHELRIALTNSRRSYQHEEPLRTKFLRFVQFRNFVGLNGFTFEVPVFEPVP